METVNIKRIIDANGNRACEGLRVVEEFFRFVIEDAELTDKAASLRRETAGLISEFDSFIEERDTDNDPGKERPGSGPWKDYKSLVRGNFRRVEEAMRVIEEFSRLLKEVEFSRRIQKLRFQVYNLEKEWIVSIKS